MKLREASIIVILSIVLVCVAAGLISTHFIGNDNPIEEVAEKIIEDQTGIPIDLSPQSPEGD